MSEDQGDGGLTVQDIIRHSLGGSSRVRVVDCLSAQTLRVVAVATDHETGVLEIVVRV